MLSDNIKLFHEEVQKLKSDFEKLEVKKINWLDNQEDDALVEWASTVTNLPDEKMLVKI